MAWVDDLTGKVVALDTGPLIYFIEEHPVYLPIVEPFFQALDAGRFKVVTSTLTLLEVLVQPLRQGNQSLAKLYETILLEAAGITALAITATIAQRADEIRASQNVATPDALQLATAIENGASAIVTNDLRMKPPANLQIILLDELLDPTS
ncbi:MAG TPA: type II toxin-antitoxin system VapC family toxin [Pirellulales bacterium]|nr:type II toxin-antitoxin system VapC family toxin [Pirellulales bacterium]